MTTALPYIHLLRLNLRRYVRSMFVFFVISFTRSLQHFTSTPLLQRLHHNHMMHLNRLRLTPQQPNILPESLRLPKLHVRLFTRPPNRYHSRFTLHALVLNLLVRNSVRSTHVSRRPSLLLQPLPRFRRIALPILPRLAITIESRELRHRRFKRRTQSTCRFEVYVEDIHRPGHDGCAALQVWRVGVRGDEGFVRAEGVPVEEHLERGGVFDGGTEVHFLEAILLAQSGGYVFDNGGAGVGGFADGYAGREGDEGDFGGGHFGGWWWWLMWLVWLCGCAVWRFSMVEIMGGELRLKSRFFVVGRCLEDSTCKVVYVIYDLTFPLPTLSYRASYQAQQVRLRWLVLSTK